MNARWDFKNYVLGAMFYRYISETLAGYTNANEAEAGIEGFRHNERLRKILDGVADMQLGAQY